MSNGRPKVLLFSTMRTTFVEDDLQLIQRIANVKWVCSKGFLAIAKLKWAMLFRKVGIAWFASVYSGVMVFFSRLFRKESVIIIGGADVITDPHLGYGLLMSGWKRPIVRYAVRNATKVLPTSDYLKKATLQACDYKGANLQVCFPGLDSQFWSLGRSRDDQVLSVAYCDTIDRISVKGIDLVLETARQMGEVSFRIVGVNPEVLSQVTSSIPENVQIRPPLERGTLLEEYQQAAVYLQLSRVESFGIATAEAMLCGCIPVVSDVGGLPETVGNVGCIVPNGDVTAIVSAVHNILRGKTDFSEEACRQWAAYRFSIQQREETFRDLLLG